jgi:hypothetical protein
MHEAEILAMQAHGWELAVQKDTLTKSEKRIKELDSLIMRLYENYVCGNLTDERLPRCPMTTNVSRTT